MPFPRNREHELNGRICFGEVGPWRVNRQTEKNSWVSSPYITTEVNAVRNDCYTVLLSRDQVYAWDVEGDIYEPFKYMYGYSGMPPDLKPSMVTGHKTAIFAIHLSRRVNVKSLQFSTFHKAEPEGAGWLKVRYGDKLDKDLKEVLYLGEENNETIADSYRFDENIGQGNLLLIEIGPYTQVPYMVFEILHGENTIAFHHKIPDAPVKGMAHMMGMARVFSPIDHLPPHMLLNNFQRSQVDVDVSKTVSPLGIRVDPAFVEGDKIPVMLDSQFKGARLPGQYYHCYGSFYNWPEKIKANFDSTYMIVYEYIARWGCRKCGVMARKVDVTTEIVMPDEFPMTNRKKSGINYMDGFIMEDYFPLDDPFEAAAMCSKLFEKLKKTFTITKFGVLLNMDRDYAFFFIQHMRTVYGDLFIDFIVISIKSAKDWENLPHMISFLATYAEQKKITVRVDYDMPFDEYPAAIMLCSLWRVEGFIWASYIPHLLTKGISLAFDGLLTWWDKCGDSTLTKLFVTHDFVDAILIDYNTGERTQWLCRPIGFGDQKLYYHNQEVKFPIGCKTRISENRKHKILKRGDKKKRLKMV
jgi:hypothetical protein